MKRFALAFLLALLIPAIAPAAEEPTTQTIVPSWSPAFGRNDEPSTEPLALDAGKYAVFHSSEGDFVVRLLEKEAPSTVENFVALASGTKKWTHPITGAESDKPIFNNTTVYQTVRNVLIRGGDPIDKGIGGPGYSLDSEIAEGIGFGEPGMLAMELMGKKSAGSRWFISLTPLPDYTGKNTIFGKVVGGLDVVYSISRKPTKRNMVPLEPAVVSSIEIIEIPRGNRARAAFSIEDGRKVLTVDKNYETVAVAPEEPTTTSTETATSGTATLDTGTTPSANGDATSPTRTADTATSG